MLCECKDKNYFASLQITDEKAPSSTPYTPTQQGADRRLSLRSNGATQRWGAQRGSDGGKDGFRAGLRCDLTPGEAEG